MRALGFDGGLAHAGLAVADIAPGAPPKFLHAEVVETKKGTGCLVAEDHSRRATELAQRLEEVFELYRPEVVYAENFSPPRDARNASMLAWSWGVLNAIALLHDAKVYGKSPVRLKEFLTGDQHASKAQMIAAVHEQYPEVQWPARQDLWEHIADACAAVHAFQGARA